MSDPGLASEPRRLADFLRERREEILDHWERQVRSVAAARNLDRPVLLDHLPQFIDDLAEYVGEVRTGVELPPPEELSRIHALERLEVGYDLAEVVAEYGILRRCITELAAHEHAPSLRSAELPRLHQAIDHAIAISVVRYTAARERTLRALDRISSAALVHHDVESLLPRTLDAFLGTTASVDSVALALREDGDGLRIRAAVGFPPSADGQARLSAQGFIARVEQRGEPVFVRDAEIDPELRAEAEFPPGTQALYGVPLTMGKDLLGVAVMGSRSTREFSQEDQFLFRTMVNRLAALIAQARLDAQVAHRAAELEAVIESIPEAVYVGDATGIKRANRAALEMLGYGAPGELNKDISRLSGEIQVRSLDGAAVPIEEQVFAMALRGEHAVREVIVRHRGSGEDLVVRSSAAPIRLGDRIVGVVAVNTDITARMREERDLRTALAFRDRMLGVLSHDLRNPLSVILTSAETLQRQEHDDRHRATLRRVIDNARRIERMIHDLLDYTRTREGRGLPISRTEADLVALCQQVLDGMQVLHPDRALRLSTSGDTKGSFDPDRATQAIGNLLSNAIRYSPDGSPVTVTLSGRDTEIVLEVHNQGTPIAEDLLPRLFDAFQRGVPDERGWRAGLGLGLYIVQQIVEAHGGSIEVRSTAKDGTTFAVRWPRRAA